MPRKKRMGQQDVVRRNITLPKEFTDRMNEIKKRAGITSDSELIRRAIALLDAATGGANSLLLRDEETGKEQRVIV